MNRRGFLGKALGAFVGATLIPKVPFIPAPAPPFDPIVSAVTANTLWPKLIADNFFKPIPLFEHLRNKGHIKIDGGTHLQKPWI